MANIMNMFPGAGGANLKLVTGTMPGTANTTPTTFNVPGLIKILAFCAHGVRNYSGSASLMMRKNYEDAFTKQGISGTGGYTVDISNISGNVVTYYSTYFPGGGGYTPVNATYMALGE